MKALILGDRIHQLSEKEFPVAPPLEWVDVPDGTNTNDKYVDGTVVKPPAVIQTKENAIAAIESSTAVTQRGIREFVLAVAELLPLLKSKPFFKVADDAEKLIAAERGKTPGLEARK